MSFSGSALLLPPNHAAAAAAKAIQRQRAAAEAAMVESSSTADFEIPGAFYPVDDIGNRIGTAEWVSRSDALDIPEYVWLRIPEPTGWRILVQERMAPMSKKVAGTDQEIFFADQSSDWHNAANYIGRVIAVGPACYRHPKFQVVGDDGNRVLQAPWCRPGQWITFQHYAGTPRRIPYDGVEWRFRAVFDENVENVAPTPEGLKVYGK
jgi:hypothetical protein